MATPTDHNAVILMSAIGQLNMCLFAMTMTKQTETSPNAANFRAGVLFYMEQAERALHEYFQGGGTLPAVPSGTTSFFSSGMRTLMGQIMDAFPSTLVEIGGRVTTIGDRLHEYIEAQSDAVEAAEARETFPEGVL